MENEIVDKATPWTYVYRLPAVTKQLMPLLQYAALDNVKCNAYSGQHRKVQLRNDVTALFSSLIDTGLNPINYIYSIPASPRDRSNTTPAPMHS